MMIVTGNQKDRTIRRNVLESGYQRFDAGRCECPGTEPNDLGY
jgi:hypothetical protein